MTKNRILVLFVAVFCSCKSQTIVGTYRNHYGLHEGVSYFVHINADSSFSYEGFDAPVTGTWKLRHDTLLFYSPFFKPISKLLVMGDEDFFFSEGDSLRQKKFEMWLQDTSSLGCQLTSNDSIDIFVRKQGKLMLLNERDFKMSGLNEEIYLDKIKDSADYEYWKKRFRIR